MAQWRGSEGPIEDQVSLGGGHQPGSGPGDQSVEKRRPGLADDFIGKDGRGDLPRQGMPR